MNMRILQLIVMLLAVPFLTPCTRKLSKTDRNWIPYNGNETLVFRSNTWETDTIFLLKKVREINRGQYGQGYEEVFIRSRHSDTSAAQGRYSGYSESNFVTLSQSYDRKPVIYFTLSARNAYFDNLTGAKIDTLVTQTPTSLQTAIKMYNDIYIIESKGWLNKQQGNFVSRLYWSRSAGLVRYDKQNGVHWELIKAYRQ
jgi:hypothetical protein